MPNSNGPRAASPRLPVALSPPRPLSPSRRRSFYSVRMPQLIDRLVLSDLTRFFLFILGGFSALILIITLFQLLDYITRNNIDPAIVANYLLFLLPWIVNSVAPMVNGRFFIGGLHDNISAKFRRAVVMQ